MKLTLCSLLAGSACFSTLLADYSKIIPAPQRARETQGVFTLSAQVEISASAKLANEVKQLQQLLAPATGYTLKVTPQQTEAPQIHLSLNSSLEAAQALGSPRHSVC